MSKGYIAWGILTEKRQDVIEVHKIMHCVKKLNAIRLSIRMTVVLELALVDYTLQLKL